MKKVTGVLSALLGAGLVASITLNVCYYRKFNDEKGKKIKQAAAAKKAKPETKKRIDKSKTVPRPLIVKKTGSYSAKSAYIEFNTDPDQLRNLKKEQISVSPSLPFELSFDHYRYVRIKADFQPETSYRFTIRKGLENKEGGKLEYDAEFQIRFPALPTGLKTLSSGLVFPQKRANRILPLEICNLNEIRVKVLHLYENNLLRFSSEPDWDGEITLLIVIE